MSHHYFIFLPYHKFLPICLITFIPVHISHFLPFLSVRSICPLVRWSLSRQLARRQFFSFSFLPVQPVPITTCNPISFCPYPLIPIHTNQFQSICVSSACWCVLSVVLMQYIPFIQYHFLQKYVQSFFYPYIYSFYLCIFFQAASLFVSSMFKAAVIFFVHTANTYFSLHSNSYRKNLSSPVNSSPYLLIPVYTYLFDQSTSRFRWSLSRQWFRPQYFPVQGVESIL